MNTPYIAALSFEIATTAGTLQLLPAGEFRANDGRPVECDAWRLSANAARRIVDAIAARKTPMVLDYEHQTLSAATSGTPAPAAAWIKAVEWRDGGGLFAADVEWTARASAFVAAREYRYISPVFTYDEQGNVLQLINAALTNSPALDGMSEVMLAAASRLAHPDCEPAAGTKTAANSDQEHLMKALMAVLRLLLKLPETATEEEATARLTELATKLGATAAASVDLAELIAERDTRITALTSATPDPAKYVPIAVANDLRTQLAQVVSQSQQGQIDGLVTAALSDGRLLPSEEAWARELGRTNFALLKQHVENATSIAALRGLQTSGREPRDGKSDKDALTDGELAICRQLGVSAEDYAKTKGVAQ